MHLSKLLGKTLDHRTFNLSPRGRDFIVHNFHPGLGPVWREHNQSGRPDQIPRVKLLAIRAAILFFQDSAETAATKAKPCVDLPFRANARTPRGHSASGYDPDPTGTIVNLICSIAEHTVTILHSTYDTNFLISITAGIGIDL